MREPSSKPSTVNAFRIQLPEVEPLTLSDDPIKALCEIAVANIKRLDQMATAMERGLSELPPSEMSRIVRTIVVTRSNAVKLATNAVGDLTGPLKLKNKVKDV